MQRLTLVTCLFDLAPREPSRRWRDIRDLLDHGEFVFGLDCDVVFFAEPALADEVTQRRRRHGLLSRTVVVPTPVESLSAHGQLAAIAAARRRHPLMNDETGQASPLRTALGWAKLELIRRAIEADRFGATHVAWIDLNVAQNARTEYVGADEVFTRIPEPMRLLLKKPLTADEFSDRPHYLSYLWGHVSCAYMSAEVPRFADVCEIFDQTAREALELGYAATVDQILAELAWREPERFDFHYGNEGDVLANFRRPRGAAETLLTHLRHCRSPIGWDRAHGRRLATAILGSIREGVLDCTAPQSAVLLEECFLAIYFADYPDQATAREVADLYMRRARMDLAFRDAFLQSEVRVRTNFSVLGNNAGVPERDACP